MIKKATDDARRIKMDAIASVRADIAKLKHDADAEITEQLNNIEISKVDLTRKRERFYRDLDRIGYREEQLIAAEGTNLKIQRELNLKLAEVNEKLANIAHMSLEEVKEAI
ncbi:hypothetical protein Zmor_008705 [Zophobas morio]|uniref:Uncharacterized protein n=1 Tax=Zophobas morio TaxID=2755281 RepID=A0AA38HJF8_9CUCU|nr:hypothetical protein Zmor_008705 [Zophobas morio]